MKELVLLTGAAARISQEVAVLDQLILKKGLTLSPDETCLAGFSSGALNIAAINACFRKENPLSWDSYYKDEILFNLNTEQIFHRKKPLPFSTEPLREKIEEFMGKAGFRNFHDLPFHSYILVFSLRRLSVRWASNQKHKNGAANLIDLLMATSAIPIIFPDQPVLSSEGMNCNLPPGHFLDGGSIGTFVGFKAHLQKMARKRGPFERLFIISPMREVTSEDFDEFNSLLPSNDLLKLNIKDFGIIKNFLSMISMNGFDTFIKQFYKWNHNRRHSIAREIYVCVPQLPGNFPILNFNKQKIQYESVVQWASENPGSLAIPLDRYMVHFNEK